MVYKYAKSELNLVYLSYDLGQMCGSASPLERAAVLSPKPRWHLASVDSFIDSLRRVASDWISFNFCFHLRYTELYWQAEVAWADAATKCGSWYLSNPGVLPPDQSVQHHWSAWNALKENIYFPL